MSEGGKRILEHRISRRGAVGSGLAALAMLACDRLPFPDGRKSPASPTPQPQYDADEQLVARDIVRPDTEIISTIKAHEAALGKSELTYEQAKEHLGLVTDFYLQASESTLTKEDLSDRVLLIRRPVGKNEYQINDPDGVAQFKKDYPDVELPDDTIRKMVNNALVGAGGAISNEGFVYVGLDFVNRISASQNLQFTGTGRVVKRESLTPAVKLRSVLTHELSHYDVEKDSPMLSLDGELRVALLRNHDINPDYGDGKIESFMVLRPESIGSFRTTLNEFANDYHASRLSRVYNLPYVTSFYPSDFVNFEIMLSQMGLDFKGLKEMRGKSQLKEFLLTVADRASNITFANDDEKLDFSLATFSLFFPPTWDNKRFPLERYYPGIRGERYIYHDSQYADNRRETDRLGYIP